MSSPLAKKHKTPFDRVLIALHQRLSHRRRVEKLAGILMEQIVRSLGGGDLIGLDLGCGDMGIAETLMAHNSNLRMFCGDLYERPLQVGGQSRWSKYVHCPAGRLPFNDREFDFVLLVDVLHHISREEEKLARLTEASRVATHVIIKDHLMTGWPSRLLLQAMDFVGNYGYGVSVPTTYFTHERYEALVARAGLRESARVEGLPLYAGTWLSLLGPDRLQFISILSRNGNDA